MLEAKKSTVNGAVCAIALVEYVPEVEITVLTSAAAMVVVTLTHFVEISAANVGRPCIRRQRGIGWANQDSWIGQVFRIDFPWINHGFKNIFSCHWGCGLGQPLASTGAVKAQ
ncbi:MAG: hypothetical protein L3K26_06795 [Candidatus Hydrogenedentes bacterium]|nr:hypothetical protein [Candidatus Hydrogenedentota bacterium]